MINFILFCFLQIAPASLIAGASSAEDLDQQTFERLESLRSHPIDINASSQSRLASCGLFSSYQAASIVDYRQSNGDILSLTEFGLIDGIGPEYAAALKDYVIIQSRSAPGQKHKMGLDGKVTARYGSSGYFAKGQASLGDRVELALSSKKGAPFNGSLAYYGRRSLGKVVLGSFNARYGQGLTLWSGMTMSGFSSPDAFCKRSTGISLATTTSPSSCLQGAAADFSFGKWALGTLLGVSDSGFLPAVNCGYLGRKTQFSLTVAARTPMFGKPPSYSLTAGADLRTHLGKFDLFAEAAWDFTARGVASVLGLRMDPAYQVNWTILSRYYSPSFVGVGPAGVRSASKTSDEAGVSLGGRVKWFSATLDGAYHPSRKSSQFKALAVAVPVFKAGPVDIQPTIRLACRWKPQEKVPLRCEARGQVDVAFGGWKARARADCVWCKGFSWLWLAEGGYASTALSVYLRGGLFRIDNWDDRIYVYERDVPGFFNVPAYYGRGWNASLVASYKIKGGGRRSHKIDARISTVQYPWTAVRKEGKLEYRAQYSFTF